MLVGINMQQPTGLAAPPQDVPVDRADEALVKEAHAAVSYGLEVADPHDNNMNGTRPMAPQQVYLNPNVPGMPSPDMAALGAQFQSLGFKQDESIGTDQLTNSGNNSESNNNEENEGEEAEDDPIKLFVGQIPKNMSEEDIFPTFDSFGPLKDVAIIRDKHTGLHRGCAFVTYWSAADALRAQESLHDKYTFQGAKRPSQVKPAEPSVPENKLFIGMLSRKAGEAEVRELFSPFGEIREVYMIRNADGSSKCAAFLRFVKRESAVHAIENLNGSLMMEGAARPLIVKFADTKHQRELRQMRMVRRHEMLAAMGAGPPGYPVFPSQVPPHMSIPAHPGAAPQYAMPPHQYPGGYAAAGQPPPPPPPHPYMYPPHQYGPAPPYAYHSPQERRSPNPRPREGPAGANLFVYHLPHDLTDADLATAFNPFGNVISAKVYVDKYTGESKGFGFVSYDSVISAESAIEQMNGFQIGNKRLKVQHKRVHGSNSIPSPEELPLDPQEPFMNAPPPGVPSHVNS